MQFSALNEYYSVGPTRSRFGLTHSAIKKRKSKKSSRIEGNVSYISLTDLDKDSFIDKKVYDDDSKKIYNHEDFPDMWSLDFIGLYSQYAAVGLLYGSCGTCAIFCPYVFNGFFC